MSIAVTMPVPASAEGAQRVGPAVTHGVGWRVYSPLAPRRLARPMAIPAAAARARVAPSPGRRWLPFRLRRQR